MHKVLKTGSLTLKIVKQSKDAIIARIIITAHYGTDLEISRIKNGPGEHRLWW